MLWVIVGLIVLAYVGVVAALFIFQRAMLFPLDARRADPALTGIPGLEEISLTSSDGERLVAWHLPPREGRPVLVYYHGNARNLGAPDRLLRFRSIADEGLGFLAVSYRGYGGSTGSPSEVGLHLDARAAYEEAARRYGAERLAAYGESLGTGVATRAALENPVTALVLETPYTSTADVAQGHFFNLIPMARLMHDQFRSDRIIGGLRVPVLILHGTRDWVIPFALGERLYGLAPQPKRFAIFEGGSHINLHELGAGPVVTRFLEEVAAGRMHGAETIRLPPRPAEASAAPAAE